MKQDPGSLAMAAALAMLARRDFAGGELQSRLQRKGHSEESAIGAVRRCEALGYVDDRVFATTRAKSLLRRRPSGRIALVQDLQRQTVDRTMCEQVADAVYLEAGGETAVLADALRRWIARHGDPVDWRAVRRCADHLARRGFASAAVHAALSPWLDELGT